jgi:hypothetical protein
MLVRREPVARIAGCNCDARLRRAIPGLVVFFGISVGASLLNARPAGVAQVGPPAKPTEAAPSALTAERLLAPGPEAQELARQVGTWNVVVTMHPTPNGPPVVVSGIVAERTMVGLYLNEVMKPAPGSNIPDFRRIDYLTYDAVQARWEYAAMDTRAPVGIMFAKSYGGDRGPDITVYFDSFANPGIGAVGGSVRARHVDKRETDNRRLKQQYWTVPGEQEWLAIQYEYTRRP